MPFKRKFTAPPAPAVAPKKVRGAGKDDAGRRIALDLGLRIGISGSCAARWHREGAPFPPDLDSATQAHYDALMRWVLGKEYRVPEALARLAAGDLPASTAPTQPPPQDEEEAPLEKGLRAEMRRLEDEAATNYVLYKRFERGDPALRTSYHKVWTNSVQTLAKVAKEVPDHELEEGRVIPVDAVRRVHRTMLAEFRVAMDALPFRLASLLGGITDPVTRQEIIEREKEAVLKMLREVDWKTKITSDDRPRTEPTESGPAN